MEALDRLEARAEPVQRLVTHSEGFTQQVSYFSHSYSRILHVVYPTAAVLVYCTVEQDKISFFRNCQNNIWGYAHKIRDFALTLNMHSVLAGERKAEKKKNLGNDAGLLGE